MNAGRPKGRKFSSFSASLPQEQIDWLNAQTNASETLRRILSEEMAKTNTSETPESIRAKRLKALNERLIIATMEKGDLLRQNRHHFKGHTKREQRGIDSQGQPYYYDPVFVLDNEDDPTPLDKTGEIAKMQIAVLDAEIQQLNRDIDLNLHPQSEEDESPKEYSRYME